MTPQEFIKIRMALKFSQKRLADTLGFSERQLQRWEAGEGLKDGLIDKNIAFRVETIAKSLGLTW